MFILCNEITVGGKRFEGIHEVKIKRSIHTPGATATLSVPVTAVLRQAGEAPAYTQTAQAVAVGDAVEIRLGYNGRLSTEFRGYVKEIKVQTPLQLVCEDAFYLSRQRTVTLEGRTTLEEVLRASGLDVASAMPLKLDAFPVDHKPAAWALGRLQSDYGLSIWFDTEGRVYADEPEKVAVGEVRYRLRSNVVKDDQLTFRRAAERKLKIRAVSTLRDGSRLEAVAGPDEGTEKKLTFNDVTDERELRALAVAELRRQSYDGYTGKITAFLEPYAAPCMVARIEDEEYPQRAGSYLIESVETTYSASGARRMVEIGMKL